MPNLKRQEPAAGREKPKVYFLPEVLEERRRALKLNQQQLAEKAFLTQAQISRLEVSDGHSVPSGDNLYLLAKALGVSMEHLLSENPPD